MLLALMWEDNKTKKEGDSAFRLVCKQYSIFRA